MKITASHNYSRSFTAGALMLSESNALTELYQKAKDWNVVRTDAIEKNILHARTRASLIRIVRETINRLQCLTEQQVSLFNQTDKATQKLLLWYAICKSFPFVSDFAKEVLHEKFMKMEQTISLEDLSVFFIKKAGWNEDLENKSESTKSKMKQVLLRMLREADFIDTNDKLLPVFIPSAFASSMNHREDWQSLFPAHISVQELSR